MTGSWMQEGRVGVSAPADRSTSTAEASTDGHLRQEAPENGRDVVRRMRDGVPIDVLAVLREAESEPRRQHTLRSRARATGTPQTHLGRRVEQRLDVLHPLRAARDAERALDLGRLLLQVPSAATDEAQGPDRGSWSACQPAPASRSSIE